MAEVNALKKKLTEIFDDENVYTEFREKIKNSILNRLYYSKCKDTHFYTSPEVFDQFLDMIIKDMLDDCDFKNYIESIRELQNPDEREVYLYRRDHRPDRNITDSEIQGIQRKIISRIRLEPDEEKKYDKYKQKKSDHEKNNQLVLDSLNGDILSEEQKAKMDEYLGTLMPIEKALECLKEENRTPIKNLRIRAKNYCFNTFLPKMEKELISCTSNPFELKNHELNANIFKGANGNKEFIRVDESRKLDKGHDFDVNSEYIIIVKQRLWIDGSVDKYGYYKDHESSKFLIYMPSRETEYSEGTHLSDLQRIKKENGWKEQIRDLVTRLMYDGARIADIKSICDSIIEEERESK